MTVLAYLATGLLTLTAPFLIAHIIRRHRAAQRRWEDERMEGMLGVDEGDCN